MRQPLVYGGIHFELGDAVIVFEVAPASVRTVTLTPREPTDEVCARPGCGHSWEDHDWDESPAYCLHGSHPTNPCSCEGYVESEND